MKKLFKIDACQNMLVNANAFDHHAIKEYRTKAQSMCLTCHDKRYNMQHMTCDKA